MPIIIGPRKKYKPKLSQNEYIMTKLLIDNLYIDYELDYKLSFNYNLIIYNDTFLHFPERYSLLGNMPNSYTLFRPLKSDKHANILIDMFDQLDIIKTDSLTILESNDDNGNKTYRGYFTYKGKKVDKSYTYNAPTTAILKSFMVAKLILDSDDYDIFINNLMSFTRRYSNHRGNENV